MVEYLFRPRCPIKIQSREGWGACGLDPDDIEWDIITAQDEADWEKACQAFGMTKTALLNLEGAPA